MAVLSVRPEALAGQSTIRGRIGRTLTLCAESTLEMMEISLNRSGKPAGLRLTGIVTFEHKVVTLA